MFWVSQANLVCFVVFFIVRMAEEVGSEGVRWFELAKGHRV